MSNEIIEFKSEPEYFKAEHTGVKNNTVREIDLKDERFQKLIRAWKTEDYPYIRIIDPKIHINRATIKNPDAVWSFVRKIRHIAIYKNLMVITWTKEKVKK